MLIAHSVKEAFRVLTVPPYGSYPSAWSLRDHAFPVCFSDVGNVVFLSTRLLFSFIKSFKKILS